MQGNEITFYTQTGVAVLVHTVFRIFWVPIPKLWLAEHFNKTGNIVSVMVPSLPVSNSACIMHNELGEGGSRECTFIESAGVWFHRYMVFWGVMRRRGDMYVQSGRGASTRYVLPNHISTHGLFKVSNIMYYLLSFRCNCSMWFLLWGHRHSIVRQVVLKNCSFRYFVPFYELVVK